MLLELFLCFAGGSRRWFWGGGFPERIESTDIGSRIIFGAICISVGIAVAATALFLLG